MVCCVDAEDSMSGVEIESSIEEGEDSTQADGATEVEASGPRTQMSTATEEPLHRQGQ